MGRFLCYIHSVPEVRSQEVIGAFVGAKDELRPLQGWRQRGRVTALI